MKNRILTQLVLLVLVATMCVLSSCNVEQLRGEQGLQGEKGDTGATGNGIASITTEKVDGGTKVIIKYTDPSVADVEFIVPNGEKGEQGIQGEKGEQGVQGEKGDDGEKGDKGDTGRGILKTEIIDGCLWITFTDDPENPVNVGRVTSEETTVPEEEEEEPTFPEAVDLGGYKYKAYVRSNYSTQNPTLDGNPDFYCEDFWVDPSYGEPEDALSFAVYQRNQKIENDYNVKIQQVSQNGNMAEELLQFQMGGKTFDLTVILAKSAAEAAMFGLLSNLNAMDKLDLRYSAYDQNSIKELSMGNKLYYLSGDMNISTLDNVTATIANLELYKQYADDFVSLFGDTKYQNLYNLVTTNSWTMDTLLLMAETVTDDLSGDAFGYFQYANSTMYYYYGAGGRITKMSQNGFPELVVDQEKNEMIFNYIYENFNIINSSFYIPNGYSGVRLSNFIDGITLFTDMTLWDIRRSIYPLAPFEYGILPIATYNAGDDYHSMVAFSNCAHLWAIPKTLEDAENAQIMMQAMAAYSDVNIKDSTMDAYYTRTLRFAAAANDGSRETMDIIKNSMIYDIAILYNWGGWAGRLESVDTMEYNPYYEATEEGYLEYTRDQIISTIINFGFTG